MATIVNARDVLLQAATPRVANVSVQPNLVLSQSQVTGLGIVLDGTKLVFLQATTQVFQIAKTGTISPASTTLTAVVKNLTATPTLTVTSGSIIPAPTLSGGAVTISNADLKTDAATIRLTVVQNSVTYTDEVTIVKVREGIDGLTGFLTNESHTLAADFLGNVLAYTGCGGNFRVYQGTSDISSLCTYSLVSNPANLTVSLNASTGAYSITGSYPTNADTTTVSFRATFGSTTLDKVFTVAKSKAGSNGSNGSNGVDGAPGTNGTNGRDGLDGAAGLNGQRGSRTWYVTLTGTTATYSDTLATTTASVQGGPVLNDTVTEYNPSQGFSQTKFWTGSAWAIVNAIVDGNLLVSGTVGATALSANAVTTNSILAGNVTADKITVSTLSAISASMGNVSIDSGGAIHSAAATAFGTGTGFWLGDASGTYKFRVGNPAGNRITWDGTNLVIAGQLSGVTGTFAGSLSAATGTFAGSLSAATGTFAGSLSAATGSFSGSLSAASGTFAGTLTAAAVDAVQTINIAGNSVTVPVAAYTAATIPVTTGSLQAVTIDAGGQPVVIIAGCFVTPPSGGGGGLLTINRDGTPLFSAIADAYGMLTFPPYLDNPGAGSHVYSMDVTGGGSSTWGSRGLLALGTKR